MFHKLPQELVNEIISLLPDQPPKKGLAQYVTVSEHWRRTIECRIFSCLAIDSRMLPLFQRILRRTDRRELIRRLEYTFYIPESPHAWERKFLLLEDLRGFLKLVAVLNEVGIYIQIKLETSIRP